MQYTMIAQRRAALLLVAFATVLDGLRIFKPRETALRMLVPNGEAIEERLYMEFCEHSSTTGNCGLAIDNDVIQEWTQCSSTLEEHQGWWKAQLEMPSYITRVVIHAVEFPDTQLRSALNDFTLYAGEVSCYRHVSSIIWKSKSFPCDTFGDHVKITGETGMSVLALCEVEAFGVPVTFQGLESGEMEIDFESCDQSTTFGESYCNYAIDRNFLQSQGPNKICAQTEPEENPYWVVYFVAPAMVKHVKIFNRHDCCLDGQNKFQLMVNNAMCAKHDNSVPFNTKVFRCERFGSYLSVRSLLTATLTLCQVQVFGNRMLLLADTYHVYKGCYKDSTEDPDFEMLVSVTWMAPAKCHRMCKRLSKTYFGLQNGHACMCGNKFGKHGAADITACNMYCKSDNNFMCGGENMNSVYEIIM